MSYLSAKSRQIQGRLAITQRHHPDDVQAIADLQRRFNEERIADFIAKSLADAPPLTTEQRERLALLLHGSAPAGGAAA